MPIKIFIQLFVSFFFTFLGHSQADSTFKNPHGESRWVGANSIVGTWVMENNEEVELGFIETEHEVKIFPSIRLMPYTFQKNEEGQFLSLGHAPNWPPFYVDVLFIDENTIDLFYYHLGFNGQSDRYLRKR